MKKLSLGLLCLFLLVGSMNAQEGKKAIKKGSKILAKYSQNAVSESGGLEEGLSLVEKAFESDEVKGQAKYLNMLGEAYNGVLNGQINAKFLDPTFEISKPDLAMKAMDAFTKAYSLAEKGGDKKDALAGMSALESHLNNVGISFNSAKDYANAFKYFNAALDLYKTIKGNGGKSRFDDELTRKDHLYYTAATGFYGKQGAAVLPVLEELDAEGTDKALVYEALYSILATDNKEKAFGYLTKGREMFPDDAGLLFAEINYFLVEGKLDVLTGKLKSALEKEPDNVTLYTTLGNVYDQLNQKEREAGNTAKADEYFGEALTYYGQAIEKDPKNFDAVYSQGALYYNKAASLTAGINELANDFSSAGTKKYNDLKATMDGYFGEAMPYFKTAEAMAQEAGTPDLNTLIALKEIHARKNELDKVAEYKAKIEAVQAAGGK